ncbi:outer membrane porin HofQ [Planctomycetes bacterium MalM25]|nr:outer membrane porin HofQ [Planctomycetes bacterium MalM25]
MNATRKWALAALVALTSAPTLAQQSGGTEGSQAPRSLPPTNASAVGQRYALTPPSQAKPDAPKAVVGRLLAEARTAMKAGDRSRAEKLVARASQMGVPATAFSPTEDSPSKLALELRQPARRYDPAVMNAGAELSQLGSGVEQALHLPESDGSFTRPAAALVGPSLSQRGPTRVAQLPQTSEQVYAAPADKPAAVMLAEGEQSLREGDLDGALQSFRAAAARGGLDASGQSRLDNHLRMLTQASGATPPPAASPAIDATMLDAANDEQQVLARQLVTAVGQAQVESRQIRETEPRRALEMLQKVRTQVENSGVSQQYRDQLVRRLSTTIGDTERYIENNKAQIELDETNAAILADIDRENAADLHRQAKVQELVEQYNDLMEEQRVEEAEVIVKRLREIAPNDPLTKQIWTFSKFARRNIINDGIRDRKEETGWRMGIEPDEAMAHNIGDGHEMDYGPDWVDIAGKRPGFNDGNGRMSPREQEIERRLETPVQMNYTDRPLAEVMDSLSRMAGVDIYLDPRGLNEEGVSTDTPVTLNLNDEISLKSALNLILSQFDLAYVIRDEVLKITSTSLRDGEVFADTYYVADLVIPIPNFLPSNNIGLQGMINDALAVTGYGGGGIGAPGPIALVNNGPGGAGNPDVLAQNFAPSGLGGSSPTSGGTGPGGLGGAASADFESLIELITATVAADTWAENGGGEAEIRPFPTNLSLVVSQTQSVHEEIADLLEQLRRLQDLQVTIEVRFIRLSDDFFERIGIDFDMNINDRILGTDEIVQTNGGAFTQEVVPGDIGRTRSGATVGVQAPIVGDLATVTADLDLPFRQGSFPVAQPTLGGFNPASAATFGFAILSDIEAYFLINAAQGDSRTNVLNAPKVTLFNGQQAFVSDVSESPFVISVVPVVGEFAAAQQPVIVVLSEGTMMSIQAVVSEDRRYVRLTVVPFFSEIGDIDTFTFDGTTTTDASSSASSTDSDDDGTNEAANNAQQQQIVTAGTTVQLPTFQFVSVTTTVSVPDGGTVLLGGIKRLAEGREEFGVPLLSKLPYINRLFRNVGIGRETDSLMMMVTPRIIIQEEEEERLGLAGP